MNPEACKILDIARGLLDELQVHDPAGIRRIREAEVPRSRSAST